jgi:Mn2+/Fe2+ NRAMP family transporter
MLADTTQTGKTSIWKSIGPALITASVVIGPGSILSVSKIGHQFGYQMTWVLVLAILLMISMTALSARLGVTLDNTLCEELAQRAGRPLAALAGITLFLIAACFQFGNNLGVLAAIEPFYGSDGALPYPTFPRWLEPGTIPGSNHGPC